jgi:hypothetical protein
MRYVKKNPWPGEPVIVAIPEATARSHIISPLTLPLVSQKIFHADQRCCNHWKFRIGQLRVYLKSGLIMTGAHLTAIDATMSVPHRRRE